jgi:hypothetical protein
MIKGKIDSLDFFIDSDFELLKTAQLHNLLDDSDITISYQDHTEYAVNINGIDKFACDTSNDATVNGLLLIQHQDILPEEVVKVAAFNLASKTTNASLKEELAKLAGDFVAVSNFVTVSEQEIESLNMLLNAEDGDFLLKEAKMFPVGTLDELQKSAQFFEDQYFNESLSDEDRSIISEGIFKKASELNASFPMSNRLLYHSNQFELNGSIGGILTDRANYIKDETQKDQMQKIASSLQFVEATNKEILDSLIQFEKDAGLTEYYGYELEHPIDAMITFPEITFHEKIARVVDEDLINLIGEDLATELKSENGEEVYNNLVEPLQDSINQMF